MFRGRVARLHYEIFQSLPSKKAVWVESATSLDEARSRLKELEQMFPGNYFIFDRKNACFVIPSDCDSFETPANGKLSS